jgi:hypothetical protein
LIATILLVQNVWTALGMEITKVVRDGNVITTVTHYNRQNGNYLENRLSSSSYQPQIIRQDFAQNAQDYSQGILIFIFTYLNIYFSS